MQVQHGKLSGKKTFLSLHNSIISDQGHAVCWRSTLEGTLLCFFFHWQAIQEETLQF